MVLIIMMVVAVYSSIMVFFLAKVGSKPAQSVLDVLKKRTSRSQLKNKKGYEQSISARWFHLAFIFCYDKEKVVEI